MRCAPRYVEMGGSSCIYKALQLALPPRVDHLPILGNVIYKALLKASFIVVHIYFVEFKELVVLSV